MTVGVIQAQMEPERAQGRLRLRHHLRHQLRVRLRLPARQPRRRARGHRPARPHFAIVDEVDSILIDEARTPLIISGQPEEAADTYYAFARIVKGFKLGEDYEVDEKRKTAAPTEEGVHKVEKALGIENLYAPGNGQMVNHLIQALQAQALYKNDVEYVVIGRRGQDRRRVHRPHHGGPALVGGPAPGGRGQGGREDRGGEHHRRDGHDPELLPPVREARRHDRHGAHRGQRVPRDLQARGRADPDQRAGHAPRPERPHLQDRGREVPRRRRRHRRAPRRRASRCSSARSRSRSRSASPRLLERKGIPHNVLNAKQHERRGRDHPGRRAAGRGHDRDQHGRPRRRHQARRGRARGRRPVRARHRAPRVAAHRQPAARPLRPPGRPRRDALLPLGRGRARAPVRRRPHLHDPRQARARRGRADRAQDAHEAHRGRAEARRGDATSRSARTCSSTTTC